MNNKIRVRFAPSPTGPLHIGGVRTALYNYLFARKHGGDFVLRIEDTDRNRFVEGAEAYINEALAWLGIHPDEGVHQGGASGPYRQSERGELYGRYARQLVDAGHAYYAFDTPGELEDLRNRLQAQKSSGLVYDHESRMQMKNSLTLDPGEVRDRLSAGGPFVVRLKTPADALVRFEDMIRGAVQVAGENLDDKVLLKSDGMPTYHLANVVDDHLMGISHVIRGEEWLPSTPLHVLLYRFLGWEDRMPQFAHLPLLLKPDGKGKLSKRDADKHGYPVFPMQWTDPASGDEMMGFREEGYLPEALVNFLALLGWNPGNEEEIFSMDALTDAFSIDRIGKSGARFDIEKARWFNEHYLRQMDEQQLVDLYLGMLKSEGIECSRDKALAICRLMKERVSFAHEIWTRAPYFFRKPAHYDEKVVKKRWGIDVARALDAYATALSTKPMLTNQEASATLKEILAQEDVSMGKVMQLLRVMVTGTTAGPDLMGIIEVLGGPETSNRIRAAIESLPTPS